jgi:hypothetical protein
MSNKSLAKYTSDVDEHFFGAIGRLVISWAHLEFGLDCMVDILYRGFKGNEIEPEMPRSLKRKIIFLRAAFKRLPIGDGIQGYLIFFDRVLKASETRHDIIHGVVVEQAERSGEATLVRFVKGQDGAEKRRINVTTVDILRAAKEAQELGGKALYWVDATNQFLQELVARPHSNW